MIKKAYICVCDKSIHESKQLKKEEADDFYCFGEAEEIDRGVHVNTILITLFKAVHPLVVLKIYLLIAKNLTHGLV